MPISRQSVVVMLILGTAFAQIIAMAHACPLLLTGGNASTLVMPADRVPMPADCGGTPERTDLGSTANVCELHCNASQQIDVHSSALEAPLGLQPALTIRVVEPGVADSNARATIWFSSLGAAPPLSLLFGHFLI